ncbi:MAG: S41 family peptidase, partial [Alistipes sp.]|nr:S41 family peptidase [Alistipes sp.]
MGIFLGRTKAETQFRSLLNSVTLSNSKLGQTLAIIERDYIDSISIDSLTERVLPLLIKQLDPHSVYIPASELQAVNEPLEGEFDG